MRKSTSATKREHTRAMPSNAIFFINSLFMFNNSHPYEFISKKFTYNPVPFGVPMSIKVKIKIFFFFPLFLEIGKRIAVNDLFLFCKRRNLLQSFGWFVLIYFFI